MRPSLGLVDSRAPKTYPKCKDASLLPNRDNPPDYRDRAFQGISFRRFNKLPDKDNSLDYRARSPIIFILYLPRRATPQTTR